MNPQQIQLPPFLKKGDVIGIAATARKISPGELLPVVEFLKSCGYKVKTASNIHKVCHQFAGTDQERAAGLQELFEDTSVKAIIFARGGYGTMRMMDLTDWRAFIKTPKWLCGFSDVTALLSHILRQYGCAGIHSLMAINFKENEPAPEGGKMLIGLLEGQSPDYVFSAHPFNRAGRAEGIVTGGNLSLLHAINNTPSDVDPEGKILFIEDLDEYLYHIDRMMTTLRKSGKLANLAGLIVGDMSEMNDNEVPFGKDAYQIIAEAVAGYRYPVCFGFPAGHAGTNMPLVMGGRATLTAGEQSRLTFHL